MGQRNHAVKPQVSHLAYQRLGAGTVVDVFGGHDHLSGLFADLLQECIGAFVQQARHVTLFRVAAVGGFAAFDHLCKAAQGIGGTQGRFAGGGLVHRCSDGNKDLIFKRSTRR